MTPRLISPTDAAWLLLESRDTPMHVGGLFEFTPPADAPPDFLKGELERLRASRAIPPPWNLKLVHGPLVDSRLPLMREGHDIDLDYHVRHSALPYPGGQRELGILVSRLHSHQLDMHRPLWEVHLIEGLEGDRFAIYLKMHHSLIDGVSGMRLILRTLSTDPDERGTPAFWTVGEGSRAPNSGQAADQRVGADRVAARDRARRSGRADGNQPRSHRPGPGDHRQPPAPGSVPGAELGASGPPRRPAPLRNAAVRPRPDQVAGEGRRMHAQRHRPLPLRHRAAALSRRARSSSGASPDGRHPGQPAGGG